MKLLKTKIIVVGTGILAILLSIFFGIVVLYLYFLLLQLLMQRGDMIVGQQSQKQQKVRLQYHQPTRLLIVS